ncbi:hypothetical protein [Elioraea sp.]|uniref:hypothetical protein n=1 Tax=Elioraea sp. TaxID=2185103 RepID=UPI0025B93D57|nr:hypothetical protein [Elioraea sp.]
MPTDHARGLQAQGLQAHGLQALFDRVVDAVLSGNEPDPHDAERLDLIAHDLFAASPLKGRPGERGARFPWAVLPLTATSGEMAHVALTERARLPLPIVAVEGVFADEAEARDAALEA